MYSSQEKPVAVRIFTQPVKEPEVTKTVNELNPAKESEGETESD